MKRTELRQQTVKALRALALSIGIKSPSGVSKDDLITEILAADKVKTRKRSKIRGGRSVSAPNGQLSGQKKTPPRVPSFSEATARKQPASRAPVSKEERVQKTEEAPQQPLPPLGLRPQRVAEKAPSLSGPYPPSQYENLGELPEAYGTGRLFFAARDPYWIYAYWDYTWQQMEDMRKVARHGELKLRVHAGSSFRSPIQQEITLNPSARNWFVNVGAANSDYCAELGYYDFHGRFVPASRSKPTHTPPDQPSHHSEVRFVTIPFYISFRELFDLVKDHFKSGEELADVLHRLQRAGFRFPFDYEREDEFSDEQAEALRKLMGGDLMKRIFMGSQELTEWLRRRLREETSSGLFSVSSPFGASFGVGQPRGFWFNVNAELIIYGATEPQATVTFDKKKIALKSDGTFRFQFALPDGDYQLPITATSPDKIETRAVRLHFVRDTRQEGGVGVVAHPKELKEPPGKS
jgi:hypothetical protein